MNIAKIVIAGAAALALAACDQVKPIQTAPTGNDEVYAGLIAIVDGCRVWRISAPTTGMREIFMTRCGPGAAQTQWHESCGKNCVRNVPNMAANREDGL